MGPCRAEGVWCSRAGRSPFFSISLRTYLQRPHPSTTLMATCADCQHLLSRSHRSFFFTRQALQLNREVGVLQENTATQGRSVVSSSCFLPISNGNSRIVCSIVRTSLSPRVFPHLRGFLSLSLSLSLCLLLQTHPPPPHQRRAPTDIGQPILDRTHCCSFFPSPPPSPLRSHHTAYIEATAQE